MMILATHLPRKPPDPAPHGFVGPVIDGEKYVNESIVAGTVDLTPAELRDLAARPPIAIRSVAVDGHIYYCWGDAILVAAIMTRLAPMEADAP